MSGRKMSAALVSVGFRGRGRQIVKIVRDMANAKAGEDPRGGRVCDFTCYDCVNMMFQLR